MVEIEKERIETIRIAEELRVKLLNEKIAAEERAEFEKQQEI